MVRIYISGCLVLRLGRYRWSTGKQQRLTQLHRKLRLIVGRGRNSLTSSEVKPIQRSDDVELKPVLSTIVSVRWGHVYVTQQAGLAQVSRLYICFIINSHLNVSAYFKFALTLNHMLFILQIVIICLYSCIELVYQIMLIKYRIILTNSQLELALTDFSHLFYLNKE